MNRPFLPALLGALLVLAGCTKSEPRLNGTWRSNREESAADAMRRDPRWAKASPEMVARFRDIFGHLTLTYSNGVVTTRFRDKVASLRYSVVDRGDDFVVVRMESGMEKGQEMRIRFVDGGGGFWTSAKNPGGGEIREKFDRVVMGPVGTGTRR